MIPTFSGEVRFKSYADSSSSGARVTFTLDDRDHLSKFVGLEGKRYMLAIVEIGDDDQPAKQESASPTLSKSIAIGQLCQWAIMRCQDSIFLNFIRPIYDRHLGGDGSGWGDINPDEIMEKEFCRHAILVLCEIDSRKELDTDKAAEQRFKERIMTPYQKYYLASKA